MNNRKIKHNIIFEILKGIILIPYVIWVIVIPLLSELLCVDTKKKIRNKYKNKNYDLYLFVLFLLIVKRIVCIYLIIMTFCICFTTTLKFDLKYPLATFKNTRMILTYSLLNTLDNKKLHESKLAYKLRNSLFHQYEKAYLYFPKNEYAGIALFYLVDLEYNKFKSKSTVCTDLLEESVKKCEVYPNNPQEYNNYKEKYTKELEKILSEFYLRDVNKTRLGNKNGWQFRIWSLPYRTELYQKLALSYINNVEQEKNIETVKKLTTILITNDSILNYTKLTSPSDYRGITLGKIYKQRNPIFLHKYSTLILQTENEINDKNMCNDEIVINKYIESKSMLNNGKTDYIDKLLNEKCNIE